MSALALLGENFEHLTELIVNQNPDKVIFSIRKLEFNIYKK